MTLRTGKGSQYRYDTCSTKARQGEAGCSGLTVPMDKLAKAVDEWRLLDPQRLTVMMDQVLERRQEWNDRRRGHIAELRKRVAEAEAKLKRLHEAIENGIITATDPSLEDRIAELSAIRDQAHAMPTVPLRRWSAWDQPSRQRAFAGAERAAQAAKRRWNIPAGHLRTVAWRIEVVSPSEIRILGTKTELLRTLVAAAGVESAAAAGVRNFVPKWRTLTGRLRTNC